MLTHTILGIKRSEARQTHSGDNGRVTVDSMADKKTEVF